MFVKKTIKLGEADGVSNIIQGIINQIDVMPYKLAHRLNRQLVKLAKVGELIEEARSSAIESVIGKEAFEEIKTSSEDKKLTDVMTEEQLKEFSELFNKEMQADYDADLLNQSFEEFIPDEAIDRNVAVNLSALVTFYEENGAWEENNEVI